MTLPLVAFLFALVALVYSSVGFGGGSTYSALLALSGVDYRIVPIISLLANIIVVTGGCIRFWRAGLIDWRAILPLLFVSAPLAFLGGMVALKESTFFLVLGGGLLLSALALFLPAARLPRTNLPLSAMLVLSAAVGLLAGLSGIGGGIFMSPMLHLTRWADARRIAAFSSVYIFVNSVAGVAGQMSKSGGASTIEVASSYWPLLLAVFVGGQIGSYLGLRLLSPVYLRWLTAILVAYVAVRLLAKALWPN
jgi:uncharacterized protein